MTDAIVFKVGSLSVSIPVPVSVLVSISILVLVSVLVFSSPTHTFVLAHRVSKHPLQVVFFNYCYIYVKIWYVQNESLP